MVGCILICTVLYTWFSCLMASSISWNHDYLRYEGRYITQDGVGIEFDAPGFRITAKLKGVNEMSIRLSSNGVDQPNRFWVYIDDMLSEHIIDMCNATVGIFTSYSVGYLDGGVHTVSLVKVTEADFNNPQPVYNSVTFGGFELDQGDILPLAPMGIRGIQFIGDSITAGYCNMCKTVTDTSCGAYAQESFASSWSYLVSQYFHATYQASAWSGYGLVRNIASSDGDVHMPEIFSRTISSSSEYMWDYSVWTPQVVVINLGTNDQLDSTNPGTIEAEYVDTYKQFIVNISNWFSNPYVFVACGPMNTAYCPYVLEVVNSLERDYPVYFLDQRGVLNSTNVCCGHPDQTADFTLAELTIDALSKVVGWNA